MSDENVEAYVLKEEAYSETIVILNTLFRLLTNDEFPELID